MLSFKEFNAPKTLYVRRDVVNGNDIVKWAKAEGFEKTLAPSDMHVTIAYSKKELKWPYPSNPWDVEVNGGERSIERLGNNGEAVVLKIQSAELESRWAYFIRNGASWDWDGYKPHVTISYAGSNMDISKIAPYQGRIVLGPEKYEELDTAWVAKVKEE